MAKFDVKVFNQKLQAMNASVVSSRAQLSSMAGVQYGDDRDTYKVLGYPRNLTFSTYYDRYKRHDIANIVVSKPAKTAWRRNPIIHEVGVEDEKSAFVKEWDLLAKRLKVYKYMERADRLMGIGDYGGIFLGIAGETDLSQPIKRVDKANVIYLQAFHEGQLSIKQYDNDAASPRYSLPTEYSITMVGVRGGKIETKVHFSRIIHLAENIDEGEVLGTPRLRNVMNRVFDLEKLVGGGAEAFWRIADRGFHVNVDANSQISAGTETGLEDQMVQYIHDMRRTILTQGVDIKELGGQGVNPKETFDVIISCISGATGIPNRILTGTERGELASSTDQESWFGLVGERQIKVCEDVILKPFIDKMIVMGVLSAVDYEVEWPSLFEKDPKEKAETANLTAEGLKNFAEAKALGAPMTDAEFREKLLDLPPEMEGDPIDLVDDKQLLAEADKIIV